eukprot:1073755-Rhodomonas_salina.3
MCIRDSPHLVGRIDDGADFPHGVGKLERRLAGLGQALCAWRSGGGDTGADSADAVHSMAASPESVRDLGETGRRQFLLEVAPSRRPSHRSHSTIDVYLSC